MGYLFLVNLGPIQSFIANGRRTRDLWFGSTLLSELSKTAAWAITQNPEGVNKLIFPKPEHEREDLKENSHFAVANKIVAYIEGDPTVLGASVCESVQRRLKALNASMYRELERAARENNLPERQIENLIDLTVANKQVDEMIDCVWVAVEYVEGKDDYAEKRDKLEQWLDARKSTRNFSSVTYGSNQPKSSIDGQLESVVHTSFYPPRDAEPKVKRQEALKRYRIFRIGPSEYLSGVDLLKRRGRFQREQKGEAQDTFLSTSHIAAISYLKRLEQLFAQSEENEREKISKSWENYIDAIQQAISGLKAQRDPNEALASVLEKIPEKYAKYQKNSVLERSDGALLFEERLREDFPDSGQFRVISDALNNFFKTVEQPTVRPHPYYAILRADGDGMGELIDRQAQVGPDFAGHQEVSRKLTAFAGTVEEIVEKECEGTLLYSGGDDVLAFLPLHTVLFCARRLSQSFKMTLVFAGEEKPPSLSVGIAIVHHLSLLRDSLDQAKYVEEVQAKGVPGKDVLAITLYRRSGEEYSVKDKLEELDDYLAWLTPYFMSIPSEPDSAWQRISLPKGTAYELRETALRLTSFADTTPASDVAAREERKVQQKALQEALKADMLRILQRKLKASARGSDSNVKMVIQFLLCIFKKRLNVALNEDDVKFTKSDNIAHLFRDKDKAFLDRITSVDVPEFINELIIAHELADVYELTKRTRLEVQKEFVSAPVDNVEGVRQ